MLRNVSQQDISVTVLGQKLSMPICVAPISFQAMAHPDGELATVRGKVSDNSVVLKYKGRSNSLLQIEMRLQQMRLQLILRYFPSSNTVPACKKLHFLKSGLIGSCI